MNNADDHDEDELFGVPEALIANICPMSTFYQKERKSRIYFDFNFLHKNYFF